MRLVYIDDKLRIKIVQDKQRRKAETEKSLCGRQKAPASCPKTTCSVCVKKMFTFKKRPPYSMMCQVLGAEENGTPGTGSWPTEGTSFGRTPAESVIL